MIDLETDTELLGDGTCVVSVAGELDLYTAPRFEEELRAAFSAGPSAVIVDLTKCEFIDSTALGVLMRTKKALAASADALSLVTSDHNIRKIFELTGLDRMFAIHGSRAAAMNGGLQA
jgi:anti-sigma B factor antagonist